MSMTGHWIGIEKKESLLPQRGATLMNAKVSYFFLKISLGTVKATTSNQSITNKQLNNQGNKNRAWHGMASQNSHVAVKLVDPARRASYLSGVRVHAT